MAILVCSNPHCVAIESAPSALPNRGWSESFQTCLNPSSPSIWWDVAPSLLDNHLSFSVEALVSQSSPRLDSDDTNYEAIMKSIKSWFATYRRLSSDLRTIGLLHISRGRDSPVWPDWVVVDGVHKSPSKAMERQAQDQLA